MRIFREDSCGLIIDIQERLMPHIFEYENLENKVLKLIKGFKVLNIPLFITEQYTKGLGQTIEPIRTELNDLYKPEEKMSFSCFESATISDKIRSSGRDYIIIAGIESHVCVLQTVLDLIEDGFHPVIIEDCISSRNKSDKETAIKRMIHSGAIISSMESILFELTRESGTAEFKEISKIVK